MKSRTYISLFLLLAITFVPVIIHLGFRVYIVPTGWAIASSFVELSDHPGLAIVFALYTAIYSAIFHAAARLSCRAISLLASDRARTFLQIAVLCVLASFSFAKVLTYGGWDGSGGIYHLDGLGPPRGERLQTMVE